MNEINLDLNSQIRETIQQVIFEQILPTIRDFFGELGKCWSPYGPSVKWATQESWSEISQKSTGKSTRIE